ncbi:MAG: hypothetical protein RIQ89_1385 [Bacteroidota bacterium]|jgi:predicted Zn-dependent protease
MNTKIIKVLLALVVMQACAKVPITKRKQVNLLPESELMNMSLTEYRSFLSKNPPVSNSDPNAMMVKNVGGKIQTSVIKFMAEQHLAKRIAGYKWEFNLVNSPEANAWCMPGGKVVVYSGLLGITQDEASLAFVMGHEIAHAVARHGNERMSQGLLQQLGGVALNVALSTKAAETRNLFLGAYGAGSTLGILKFSRTHESEADKMGLIFAAMAGYDPSKAITFWQRMSSQGGAKPPEILSTHPSDASRIADIKAFLPTAMKYYKAN